MSHLELWYETPAEVWTEALPVGNGRLGAMVFGGIARERLQLNEDTLWTGGPYSPVNPEALPNLDAVRRLVFSGDYAAAQALADKHLMARPLKQMSFQPAGDLWIEQPVAAAATNYRRSLDLDTAISLTRFDANAATHTRAVFASAADGVIVVHMTADRPGSISVNVSLTSEQPGVADPARADRLCWRGTNRSAHGIEGRLRFTLAARIVVSGGNVTPTGTSVRVAGADELLILIDAATSFRHFDDVSGDPDAAVERRLDAAARKSAADLRAAHIADHQQLFRRFAIELGRTPAADLATNRRIAANPEHHDPALAALYVQYGRYLMIASSRPGTQPANLQGIWNDLVAPAWDSKYTTNINLQMNYWLPDPANLAECVEPLLRLAEDLSVTGRTMAEAHYGARGWVLHHNTDIWRATGPIDGARFGLWPTGGAWLCAQLWDHASFHGFPRPLVQRLLPLFEGAAAFILDVLVPLPDSNWLVTNPTTSPENTHVDGVTVCAGPAMDRQLIRDLFDALIAAAGQLGAESELVREARRVRALLPPDRIGSAGHLQEWLEDWDLDVPDIHHRHVSHLYGLYPSTQIDVERTPELAAAARRSLEIRGDDATGWGIAWRINLWARLRDGDHAHAVVQKLLSPERTYPNLFDAHPPFQIDGNFGGAAGIVEMLVQSDDQSVRLLPALPSAWPEGSIKGVRCRGGLVVDLDWAGSEVRRATIISKSDRTVVVRNGNSSVTAHLTAGEPWVCPPVARRADAGAEAPVSA